MNHRALPQESVNRFLSYHQSSEIEDIVKRTEILSHVRVTTQIDSLRRVGLSCLNITARHHSQPIFEHTSKPLKRLVAKRNFNFIFITS